MGKGGDKKDGKKEKEDKTVSAKTECEKDIVCGEYFKDYKDPIPFGSETADGAILSILMWQYAGWCNCGKNGKNISYAINIFICYLSRCMQLLLIYQLANYVEFLEDMYEEPVFSVVKNVFATAQAEKMTIDAMIAGANESAVDGTWQKNAARYQFLYEKVNEACLAEIFAPATIETVTILVLALLFGKIMGDMAGVIKTTVALWSLEAESEEWTPLDPEDKKDKKTIKKMSPAKLSYFTYCGHCTKWMALIFISLPNLCVHLSIALLAAKYVSLLSDLNSTVKAVVKLYFIIKFDGFFASFYNSEDFLTFLKGAHYLVKKSDNSWHLWDKQWYRTWGASLCHFGFGIIFAVFSVFVWYRHKAEFVEMCGAYHRALPASDPNHVYTFGNLTYIGLNWTDPSS